MHLWCQQIMAFICPQRLKYDLCYREERKNKDMIKSFRRPNGDVRLNERLHHKILLHFFSLFFQCWLSTNMCLTMCFFVLLIPFVAMFLSLQPAHHVWGLGSSRGKCCYFDKAHIHSLSLSLSLSIYIYI